MSPKVDKECTQLRMFSELRFAQSLLIPFFYLNRTEAFFQGTIGAFSPSKAHPVGAHLR